MYDEYIRSLHKYNEIKDAAQMLMGKLGLKKYYNKIYSI